MSKMSGEEHVDRDEIVNLFCRVFRERRKVCRHISCSADIIDEDCQVEVFDAGDEILDGC